MGEDAELSKQWEAALNHAWRFGYWAAGLRQDKWWPAWLAFTIQFDHQAAHYLTHEMDYHRHLRRAAIAGWN